MSVYDRVLNLCQEQSISIRELERKTGLSNGTIQRWKTAKPAGDSLEKVADIFKVSTDYLLGRAQRREISDDLELGVSAHKEGEDWTPEELDEIEQFKEFVRSKRNRQG